MERRKTRHEDTMSSDEQKPMLDKATTADSGKPNRTNREREDLLVPLPDWSIADLKDVVLHDAPISPPCCKIRAILRYYKINFKRISGKKKGSDYPGIPVLMVNGRQINDSYIIVKTLAPILTGKPMTQQELELDDVITYGLMPALEAAVVDTGADLRKCAPQAGYFCCCLCAFSLCFPICGCSKRIKKDYPDLRDVEHYADELHTRLGSNQYFGGASIGLNDVAIYGLVAPFAKAGTEAWQRVLRRHESLLHWHERMLAALPIDSLF